jgi:hypothetical protein
MAGNFLNLLCPTPIPYLLFPDFPLSLMMYRMKFDFNDRTLPKNIEVRNLV